MDKLSPSVAAREEPTQRAADDAHWLSRIKRAIRRKTGGGVDGLVVERQTDVVLLRGRCPSFYCKQVAQTAAMSYLLDGQHLQNEIEVVVTPR